MSTRADAPSSVAPALVRHREGHCLSRDGWFADGTDQVPTLCGRVVVMPFGISEDPGLLDCARCRDALGVPISPS